MLLVPRVRQIGILIRKSQPPEFGAGFLLTRFRLNFSSMNTKRVIIAVLASAAMAWAAWQAASTGWARTLGEGADRTNDTAAADRAVFLSPSDAETHAVRGGVLQRTEDYPRAVT